MQTYFQIDLDTVIIMSEMQLVIKSERVPEVKAGQRFPRQ